MVVETGDTGSKIFRFSEEATATLVLKVAR